MDTELQFEKLKKKKLSADKGDGYMIMWMYWVYAIELST